MEETTQKIINLIIETLGIDEPSTVVPDAEFIADLNASHDEIKTILNTIEEKFDLELEFEQVSDSFTVGALLELVEESQI